MSAIGNPAYGVLLLFFLLLAQRSHGGSLRREQISPAICMHTFYWPLHADPVTLWAALLPALFAKVHTHRVNQYLQAAAVTRQSCESNAAVSPWVPCAPNQPSALSLIPKTVGKKTILELFEKDYYHLKLSLGLSILLSKQDREEPLLADDLWNKSCNNMPDFNTTDFHIGTHFGLIKTSHFPEWL